MKILLCQSYLGSNSSEPLVFPLGLAYISSALKEKHELHCWDPNVHKNPMNKLRNILDKLQPDVVGVSLRNIDSALSYLALSYYPPFVSMIQLIKNRVPNCKLVVGGAAFSIFAEEIMKGNPEIDFGIVREGEFSFADLLENLDRPKIAKNLIMRNNGKLVFTAKQEWTEFDKSVAPSRELFDLEKYREKPFSMGIQARRGCCFKCTYCNNRIISGDFFRYRSPESVVDELESVVNDFGIDSFFFADSIFNFPFDYSRRLVNEINKRKLDIKWTGEFSPQFISSSFMEQAVKSGCKCFNFSSEGASTNSMQYLGKEFCLDAVDNSIKLACKIPGANVGYSFLYDLPRYNDEHTRGLMRLIPKIFITLRSKLDHISFSKIRIYPYTLIHNIALSDGVIDEKTDLLYPVYYTSNSTVNEFLTDLMRGASSLFGWVRNSLI
jgi:anaerobic magnesium-protoporphyrin IX monomethyl ester cyclase